MDPSSPHGPEPLPILSQTGQPARSLWEAVHATEHPLSSILCSSPMGSPHISLWPSPQVVTSQDWLKAGALESDRYWHQSRVATRLDVKPAKSCLISLGLSFFLLEERP